MAEKLILLTDIEGIKESADSEEILPVLSHKEIDAMIADGKIVGGIYDDRLLVKPVRAAIRYMPTAPYESPYEGAKEMLLVEEVDDKQFLGGLFNAMYEELPEGKKRKK